ncbi:membrane dipeptidase [Catenuloplanes nepalensis]|uniref:Membrane dipeptidase n=1 Tax=Catenuloplanes nepalensis TaxID=587533 RepID=A0ABT9MVU6_9ACTN|nr:dipeptidase [Catenuloplanes nepalensis]MDP9795563.1 membrane dipeptidase [Catenuloplanes nepalensis]
MSESPAQRRDRGTPGSPARADVARVLRNSPVVDGHNDLPWRLRVHRGYAVEGLDTGLPALHTDLPRLRAGGVGAQFWSVYVPSSLPEPEAVVSTMEQIDAVHRMAAAFPDQLTLARTADEVLNAFESGKIASLIGVEGGHSLASSTAVLRCLARLGVRYVTLTHNHHTPWADSAAQEPVHGGLTEEGRAIVREMQRIGVLADLAHVAEGTMDAALDVAIAPVIFSHSSCRALTGHARNVPDRVLRRLRDNGGVVQVTFVPPFVSEEVLAWERAADAERARRGLPAGEVPWPPAPRAHEKPVYTERTALDDSRPRATIGQVADHIEHARDVAGIAHIGLGGDFDGTDTLPAGLDDVSCYPRLLEELAGRGWSEADLEALTGRNVLRVLREAENAAEELLR